MDGILLIDKAEKTNSHTVMVRLRHGGFGIDRLGHGGTLDPLATGVLVVLIGRAVKLAQYVIGHDKTYRVTGVFGQMRDTFDAAGKVLAQNPRPVSRDQLEAALGEFPRQYDQTPPPFSAIKVGGVPAYRHARKGRDLRLAPRPVRILELELLNYQYPRFDLRVMVSAGTYIRSLVVDLAERLGTVAYVGALRRTASGKFTIDQTHSIDQVLTWSPAQLAGNLIPMEEAVKTFPATNLDPQQTQAFVNGQWIKMESVGGLAPELLGAEGSKILLRVRCAGKFFAVGFFDGGYLKAEKILLR